MTFRVQTATACGPVTYGTGRGRCAFRPECRTG